MASRCQLRQQALFKAASWNTKHPAGTPVVVLVLQGDHHQRTHTTTSGPARVEGHTVTIPCHGFEEVPIERVVPSSQRVAVITPDGAAGVISTEQPLDAVTRQIAEFFGAGTLTCGVSNG